uniref:hypothetical protein n=1 Tax=Ningiella ruwaisensis TaxID=2364274 RepID=UPI00109FE3D6|nr:hypothetical protein [Ningiella ruwaisensis]
MLIQVLSNSFDLVQSYLPNSVQNDDENKERAGSVEADKKICVVLLQDGVYLYPSLVRILEEKDLNNLIDLRVLDIDWMASGLGALVSSADKSGAQTIERHLVNTQQWVALCAEHSPIMTVQD